MRDPQTDPTSIEKNQPPLMRLHKMLDQLLLEGQRIVAQIGVDEMSEEWPRPDPEDVFQQMKDRSFSVFFEDTPQPTNMLGADTMILSSLSKPGEVKNIYDPFYVMRIDLFEDGSKYVPEQFIDFVPHAYDATLFSVALGAEFPPFIFLSRSMDEMPLPSNNRPRTPVTYLEYIQEAIEPVHILSEADLTSLADALDQVTISDDTTHWAHQNEIRDLLYPEGDQVV